MSDDVLNQTLDSLDQQGLDDLLNAVSAPAQDCHQVVLADSGIARHSTAGTHPHAWPVEKLCRGVFEGADNLDLPTIGQLTGRDLDLSLRIGDLLVLLFSDGYAAVSRLGHRTNLPRLHQLRQSLAQQLRTADSAALSPLPSVIAVVELCPPGAEWRTLFGDSSVLTGAVADKLSPVEWNALLHGYLQQAKAGDKLRRIVDGALLNGGDSCIEITRVAFLPRLSVAVEFGAAVAQAPLFSTSVQLARDVSRQLIAVLLGDGLQTDIDPFPQDNDAFEKILQELRQLPEQDLIGRLVQGGFACQPVERDGVDMRCRECIYYLPHARWCDLPELPLPVEADWFCRLWKM